MTLTPEHDSEEMTLREDVGITLSAIRIASGGAISSEMARDAVDMVMAAVDRYRPAPALPSTAQVTEYRLSLLPLDDDGEYRLWSLSVCRLPGTADRWYVLWSAERVLTADGGWVRRGYWEHWWPLDEALRRANDVLPSLKVNGKTAADVLSGRGEGA